jgi:hypothetical protein
VPSGREKAEENYLAWLSFRAAHAQPEAWLEFANGAKLHRERLAQALGFAKSALRQNPRIAEALANTEQWLRGAGILLPIETGAADAPRPMGAPPSPHRLRRLEEQKQRLEERIAVLEEEVRALREGLRRYGLLEEVLSETMRIPR